MSENASNGAVQKKSWFQNMQAEFKKVIWPSKRQVVKNTVSVVVASVVLGIIIAIIDAIVKYGMNFLT